MEARASFARLCVLQSRATRQSRRRLRELSRPGQRNASGDAREALEHELVSELPSASGAESASARGSDEHVVATADGGSGEVRPESEKASQCQSAAVLPGVPPMSQDNREFPG